LVCVGRLCHQSCRISIMHETKLSAVISLSLSLSVSEDIQDFLVLIFHTALVFCLSLFCTLNFYGQYFKLLVASLFRRWCRLVIPSNCRRNVFHAAFSFHFPLSFSTQFSLQLLQGFLSCNVKYFYFILDITCLWQFLLIMSFILYYESNFNFSPICDLK